MSVHPHACGEHLINAIHNQLDYGSSPRMWGTRHPDIFQVADHRFIPTHVGNTWAGVPGKGEAAVHPHACGEHNGIHASGMYRDGSSPRMWGTLPPCFMYSFASRFIPTHVGNTINIL